MTRHHVLSIVLLALLFGCGPRNQSVPMINGRVDDFEDGDRANLLGFEWEAIYAGRETNSTIFVQTGGLQSSVYQLTVGGMRPYGSGGNEVSGVRSMMAQTTSEHEPNSIDVTAYDGLELSMAGSTGSYIVQLGTTAVQDFDFYNAYVEVNELWNTFRIPFSQFKQEGFGKSIPWTGNNVNHIAVYANLFGPYSLAIDNVRFYADSEIDP